MSLVSLAAKHVLEILRDNPSLVCHRLSGLPPEINKLLLNLLQENNMINEPALLTFISSVQLTSLSLKGTLISDNTLMKIASICGDRLQFLDLSDCYALSTDGLNHAISYLTKLSGIVLNNLSNIVTNSTISHIAKSLNNSLELLHIHTCRAVTGTVQFHHLLSCSYNTIALQPDNGVVTLTACRRLKSLNFKNVFHLTDAPILQIAMACPHLEELNVRNCIRISSKSIKVVLQNCPHLAVLNIKNCNRVTKDAFAESIKVTKLVKFSADFCKLLRPEHLLPLVEKNEGLESFHISYLNMDTNGESEDSLCHLLSRVPKATSIHLYNHASAITDKVLIHIANSCPYLKTLLLGEQSGRETDTCTNITDAGIYALSRNCRYLTKVALCSVNVTDESLKFLAQGCPIERVSLKQCYRITDEGIINLCYNAPLLWKLNLEDIPLITDHSMLILATTHSNLITDLRLIKMPKITDAAIKELAENLRNLSKLMVTNCAAVDSQCIEALVKRTSLVELDISHCRKLGDNVVDYFERHAPIMLKKLSIEGYIWMNNEHVHRIVKACPLLNTLFVSECVGVNGEQLTVDRPDLTIFTRTKIVTYKPSTQTVVKE